MSLLETTGSDSRLATDELPASIASLAALRPEAVEQAFVSFDLFDTVIHRQFLRANEVHDLVGAYALTLLGGFGTEQPGDMTLARYSATNALKMSPGAPLEEPSLALVWARVIGARIGAGERADALGAQVAQFEFDVDQQNLVAVDGARTLIERLRAHGKRVVAISDMYFSGEQVRQILRQVGLLDLFERVFVSADANRTKQTGTLFTHVLDQLGIQADELLHLGDNPRSDVLVPRSLNIRAIHVDHHPLLRLERPDYGSRPDIHLEIADLIKLFAAQLVLFAASDRADQLYFLSRDGCLINQVLQRWNSPLLTRYFPGIASADLFLSRAVSCWLNVNFQDNWLLQAIGHAFWLHNGRGTAQQLSAIMGIDAVPETLDREMIYVSGSDTFLVHDAYVESGLEDAIRTSIEDKRRRAAQYLHDAGFFAHESVIISDVGYSGTVVRDLNTFFLQESAGGTIQHVPRIAFHCIASNANYRNNAASSLPHVRFSSRVPLPVEQMPQSLADSFAWLEMFFKHPTYGPLLGYEERNGRMMPRYDEAAEALPEHPASRVLDHVGPRPADIVLLWMAAVQFWGQLTEPLLKRFADPDDRTVEQMLADVYEVDAVSGETRSVVMIAPDLSDGAIYRAAKKKDFWIPGSLAATHRARRMRWIADQQQPRRFLLEDGQDAPDEGRFRRLVLKAARRPDIEEAAFDPAFYREFYSDLRALPNIESLRRHYRLHGRMVGRYGSEREMWAAMVAEFGPLPSDFDYGSYLLRNRDLVAQDPARWHAELHWLRNGRDEGREYRLAMPELDAELDAMVLGGELQLDAAEQVAWNDGVPARTILLRRHGLGTGPWLDSLDLAEFVALNHDWCGNPPSRGAALVVFLREGLERLAPLSLDAIFDPEFYRQQDRNLLGLDDRATYRHWIATGALRGLAPSEAFKLQRMIGVREFPDAFRWEAFLDAHRADFGPYPTRVGILDGFLDRGDPGAPAAGAAPIDDVVHGNGAAFVWSAVADRATALEQRRRARAALQRALEAGGSSGRLRHRLADLYRADADRHAALSHYLQAIRSPQPDRWSFINGAAVSAELGSFLTGWDILRDGRKAWRDMEPWREARASLLQRWFDSETLRLEESARAAFDDGPITEQIPARRKQGSGPDRDALLFLRRFAAIAAEDLPTGLALGRADGPVVLLAGGFLSERARWAASLRPEAGRQAVRVFSREQVRLFTESLPGASLAVLHEVELDALVVDALLRARGYGIPTVFWAGTLGCIPGGPDLSDLAWSDFMHDRDARATGGTQRSFLAATLCDRVVSTAPSLVPLLATVCRGGQVIRAEDALTRAILHGAIAPHMAGRPRVLLHLRGRPARAGVTDQDLSRAGADAVVAAIGRALSVYPEIELLLDGEITDPARTLAMLAGRWIGISEPMTSDQRTAIAASATIVIDLSVGSAARRSFRADAALHAIPTIVAAPSGADGTYDEGRSSYGVREVGDLPELVRSLKGLLDDRALRIRMGAEARTWLDKLWTQWLPITMRQSPSSGSANRRILFANLFAPPQLIGGATRVMADNLGTLLDDAGDRFDIAVLAADEENADRSATRCDVWQGVPVFRISTPQEIDMNWRLHNAEVDLYARRVIALHQPDLVHIHCLPRLSVAVAEACRDAGIPYLVTLHDGWWLSDFPFLVDEAGLPATVGPDPAAQSFSSRIGLARSLERAARLRAALQGAEGLLSVSEPFAEVYRRAGFAVRTIANGLSPMPPRERLPSHGPVRLVHVGGTQHHKGAYLVEAVLRLGRFANLSLTIVELGRDEGDDTQTVWGQTPVSIIGKLPADEIGALYARSDVLLAPSTWPESFGLVSREAQAAGLWVVATDQGAMAESVVPDRNGFVVDVRQPSALREVLQRMDADPVRFTNPPEHRPVLRSAQQQGRELIALYESMLGKTPQPVKTGS